MLVGFHKFGRDMTNQESDNSLYLNFKNLNMKVSIVYCTVLLERILIHSRHELPFKIRRYFLTRFFSYKYPHQKEELHKRVISFLGEPTEALKFFKINS